ncbi:transposase [Micromonospora sp. MW-13]|uniref:transposase n=1 Tax=Micromonospora sp. MW-13 TaxID=2094022 RepID=UPI00352ED4E4
MAAVAHRRVGLTRLPGADRLVPRYRRRRLRAGKKGGPLTGPSPVDRGKPGSEIHALSERGGLPLSVGVSAANTHDSRCLESLVQAIPAVSSRRGPRRRRPDKLHADKGYDYPHLRRHAVGRIKFRENGSGTDQIQ